MSSSVLVIGDISLCEDRSLVGSVTGANGAVSGVSATPRKYPGRSGVLAAYLARCTSEVLLLAAAGADEGAAELTALLDAAGVRSAIVPGVGPTPRLLRLLTTGMGSGGLATCDQRAGYSQAHLLRPQLAAFLADNPPSVPGVIVVADYGDGAVDAELVAAAQAVAAKLGSLFIYMLAGDLLPAADYSGSVVVCSSRATTFLEAGLLHPAVSGPEQTPESAALLQQKYHGRQVFCVTSAGVSYADNEGRSVLAEFPPHMAGDFDTAAEAATAAIVAGQFSALSTERVVANAARCVQISAQTSDRRSLTVTELLPQTIFSSETFAGYLRHYRQALADNFPQRRVGMLTHYEPVTESLLHAIQQARQMVDLLVLVTNPQLANQLGGVVAVNAIIVYEGDIAALVRGLRPEVFVVTVPPAAAPGADAAASYGACVEFLSAT